MIDQEMSARMKSMVGFRNIAVHDYQSIQIPVLKSILDHHLNDFEKYVQRIIHTQK